jgi:hypothetical protein
MYETMQSSHRLCPVMALVRAFLTPTTSGDGVGARICASLPSSPHFSETCPEKTNEFPENPDFFCPFLWVGTLSQDTRKSRWSRVGTSKFVQVRKLRTPRPLTTEEQTAEAQSAARRQLW